MALHNARVPGQGETGDDSVAVTVDTGGECVEAGQVVVADGVEPLGQPLACLSVRISAKDRTCPVNASSAGQWTSQRPCEVTAAVQ